MAEGDTARLYHRLTSYEREGWDWDVKADDPLVLQDFVPSDFDACPAPCKAYPDGLPVVGLPREWGDSEGLDLAALARILYLSARVVRVVSARAGFLGSRNWNSSSRKVRLGGSSCSA